MNKDSLIGLLLKLPRPVSSLAYRGFRRFVRPVPRRVYFDQAFAKVVRRDVEGDHLEFGVYGGSSFVTGWHAARARTASRIPSCVFSPSIPSRVCRTAKGATTKKAITPAPANCSNGSFSGPGFHRRKPSP